MDRRKDYGKKVLTEAEARCIREEPRFRGIEMLNKKKIPFIYSAMYCEEMEYVNKPRELGVAGENAEALEEKLARFVGVKHTAVFQSGTEAMHTAIRLAAEKVYGSVGGDSSLPRNGGILYGQRVFCSDLTSSVAVNQVIYEGGEPVFIDVSPQDWGMDPKVLELAFDRYPDVKLVIMAHLYGFPGQVRKIKEICEKHGALLIEDLCENFGASIAGKQTGSFGDYGVLSFDNGQIVTGAGGGVLLTNDFHGFEQVQRQIGDMTVAFICGQMKYLDKYIAKKKAIYKQYEERFSEDMMLLNPIGKDTQPNYWLSCMTVESSIIFKETRSEREYEYVSQHGTAAPMEILDALEAFGIEGSPIWKPMHMQPIFRKYDQITLDGSRKMYEKTQQNNLWIRSNESGDIFRKGLCLPSDIRMTEKEQDQVIDIVLSCYNKREMDRQMWCAI